MPFIDLNALNPLNRNKNNDDNSQGGDQQSSDQSQTAQASDLSQTQTTTVDPQAVTTTAVQDDQNTTATDMTAAVVQDQSTDPTTLEPQTQQLELQPEIATPADTVTPIQEDLSMQQEVVSSVPTPVDTSVGGTVVDLQASSSSDDQNLDKAGNPMPAIAVAQGGEVQMDESGMREVRGPDFGSTEPQQSAAIQMQNQDLDSTLNSMDTTGLEDTSTQSPEVTTAPTQDVAVEANTAMESIESVPTEVELQVPEQQEVVAESTPTVELGITPENSAVAEVSTPEVVSAPSEDSTLESIESSVDTSAVAPVEDLQAQQPDQQVPQQEMPAATTPLPELSSSTKKYSLDELLMQAISMKASDLHLTANYRAVVRVEGILQEIQSEVLDDAKIKELVAPVIKDLKIDNPEDIRDLDVAYQTADGTRFRVNIFKQQETQSAVFRLIPSKIRTLTELGMPDKLKEFTQMSQGLVLVTGPTGSGKSTTLAAMVNEINMLEPRHIITIEDPIEFVYPKGKAMVDQRSIKLDTDSWSNALKSVLRQDPDVVLIGEMRDLETITAALHIAETGHLVFGTLHTNSAAQSIDRVIDVFAEEQQAQIKTQLASVLKAVVSQRLVPGVNGQRKVASEIMITTPAVANSIRSSKVYQIDNIIQTSADLGMISMEKSLATLVQQGSVTLEQAQFYANKPDEVAAMVGRK